jgi:hypothetical protein
MDINNMDININININIEPLHIISAALSECCLKNPSYYTLSLFYIVGSNPRQCMSSYKFS